MNKENRTKPDVSVILPIYNAGKFLVPCLDSVLGQTLENIEIICVNDGSKDDSLETMRSYAKKDNRVIVVDKENGGYGCANNVGLAIAQGTYIAIVEPDDYLDLHMYADLFSFAKTFDELPDIVKSAYWRVREAETVNEHIKHCSYYGRVKTDQQPFVLQDNPMFLRHHPSIWSALYKKSFLDENNIRFREYPGAGWADNPFLVDTLCRAKSIVYLDKPYYYYREDLPGSSSVLKNIEMPFERWNEMLDILENLHIEDEKTLHAHYCRGFLYLGGILEETDGLENPKILALAKEMFSRMKTSIILSSSSISPTNKRIYLSVLGLPEQNINPLPYYWSLVKEFFYVLQINGIGFAIQRIRLFFKRRQEQSQNI